MMAMTTKSSMRVKPFRRADGVLTFCLDAVAMLNVDQESNDYNQKFNKRESD